VFPRLTTLAKLFVADYWIVLDNVQFTRRDYQHRARLAGLDDQARQQWLTIPTHLPNGRPTLIRDAVIDDPALACRRTAGMLRQHYGASPCWPDLAQALDPVLDAFATGRTAAVAEASTRVLLELLGWPGQILTSSHLAARPGRSVRLADLAAVTGARAYLCGTGGMSYLDPAPFAAQNITVAHFRPPATRHLVRRPSAQCPVGLGGAWRERRGRPSQGPRRRPQGRAAGSCLTAAVPLLAERRRTAVPGGNRKNHRAIHPPPVTVPPCSAPPTRLSRRRRTTSRRRADT
jgi:hypothetical protein